MKLNKILLVAKHEFKTTLQRRSAQFAIFILPLISIAILGGINQLAKPDIGEEGASSLLTQIAFGGGEEMPAALVDETGLLPPLNDSYKNIFILMADQKQAEDAYAEGEVDGYYIIPVDYLQTGQLEHFAERFNPTDNKESLLYQILAAAFIRDQTITPKILTQANINEIDQSASEETAGQSFGEAYGLALGVSILFYLTAMGASGYLLQSLGKEKQNRVMEILLSSLKPIELLMGKVIGLGGIGLIQMAVWITIGFTLTRGATNGPFANLTIPQLSLTTWITVLLFFLVGFMVYASIFAGIGAIAPSPKESGQVTFFMMLPTFLPMWFISIILSAPNGGFSTALSLIPLTSPVAMPMRMVLTDVPLWHKALSLLLGVIMSGITLWLASRIFRSRTLLSSSRLSFRAIGNAIRGS